MTVLFFVAGCFGIILDCLSVKKKYKRYFLYCLIVLFGLWAMMRSLSVPDTEAYVDYINIVGQDINSNGFFHSTEIYEIGFEIVIRLFVYIGLSYKAIFFVFAFAVGIIGYKVFCGKRFPIITWLIFASYYGIYFSFIILRAGISIVLFCLFVKLAEKKKIRALFALVLAFLFHQSVIFGFIVYLIARLIKRISFKKECIVLSILFVLYVFSVGNNLVLYLLNAIDKYIDFPIWNRFVYYLSNFKTGYFHISVRLVFNVVIYILCRNIRIGKKDSIPYVIDRIVFLGLAINLFLGSNTVVGRMVDYLLIFNVYNMVYVIAYCWDKYLNKRTSKKFGCRLQNNMGVSSNGIGVINKSATCGYVVSSNKSRVITVMFSVILIAINLFFIFRIF